MELANLLLASVLTVVGLYLAHSFSRQQRVKVAEERLGAYRALWELMEVAAPSRKEDGRGPLSKPEARELYSKMTSWYYDSGNGMLLPDRTQTMYLKAKEELGKYAVAIDGVDDANGERRIRELSLLRTQMKADLDIYGVFSPRSLEEKEADEEFLRACKLDPHRWARPAWYRRLADRAKRILKRERASGNSSHDETQSTTLR